MSKVLVIHHSPLLGGGSVSFVDLLTMLSNEHEVVACCPTSPSDAAQLVRETGSAFVEAPAPFPTFNHYNGGPPLIGRAFWKGAWAGWAHRRAWERLIAAVDPDIVIVNSSVLVSLGPAIRAAGAKAVCVVRETLPPADISILSRVMYRRLSRWFDGVVFISKFDEKQAREYVRSLTVVVRDCIRPSAFRRVARDLACAELGAPTDTFNVLFTGGVSRIKGLDVALGALKTAGRDDIRILVAGYCKEPQGSLGRRLIRPIVSRRTVLFERRVAALCQDSRVSEQVVFVGAQSDMSTCYSAADVVIFPATIAHQSRPIFEAGYYGLPVIATNFEQYTEHVAPELSIPTGEFDSLATSLVTLQADRARRVRLGDSNRERSIELHDLPTEREKLLSFLEKLGQFGQV